MAKDKNGVVYRSQRKAVNKYLRKHYKTWTVRVKPGSLAAEWGDRQTSRNASIEVLIRERIFLDGGTIVDLSKLKEDQNE